MLRLDPSRVRAAWRRGLLVLLVAATTAAGTQLLTRILGANGLDAGELVVLACFTLSFGWIALSLWTAAIGFLLQLFDLHPVTLRRESAATGPLPALRRQVALLLPVYNEEPARVFAGLAAICASLEEVGALQRFDLFVLSDSTDAAVRRRERARWLAARRALPQARIFYRNRSPNRGRKAGNIADWVERWGGAYDSMVVLDADSVMSGDTLVRLAALMEVNPEAGIIQTVALPANRRTLFARALQFASHLCGPLLATGQSFWQLGEANYYGHNAIIRTRAFAEHCGLPTLRGKPPLGGEILSHDFVEAACMRRGGWCIWLLPELAGSFEEVPSNLADYGVRDRRWAQGNLQHARLLAVPGFHLLGRLHLAMGVFAYLASPIWLAFLLASSAVVAAEALTPVSYFADAPSLFPRWPEYRPRETLTLLAVTVALLMLPRLLGLALALRPATRAAFGGAWRVTASAFAELVFSMLLAPVMMLLHTSFVIRILAGRAVGWGSQPRSDRGIGWGDALRLHWAHSLFGLAWVGALLLTAPGFLLWIAPVAAGLLLSIPFSVLSSRRDLGLAAAAAGLFCTPEERARPSVLRQLDTALAGRAATLPPTRTPAGIAAPAPAPLTMPAQTF